MSLSEILQNARSTPTEVEDRVGRIHRRLLSQSWSIDGPNFQSLSVSDLERLFHFYDAEFFDGGLRRSLGDSPLTFRLSRRLTSAAGQMTRRTRRVFSGTNRTAAASSRFEYEISISTPILFQSFNDAPGPIKASGILCNNRLEALQRVFEHEIVHLGEMVVWSESRCAGRRFQSIARRLFGHREHTHQLVTARDHALKKYGFRVGDGVAFKFDGKRYRGIVNRVTRRATVLVEDPAGRRYSDGKRYRRFYVPLPMLAKIEK